VSREPRGRECDIGYWPEILLPSIGMLNSMPGWVGCVGWLFLKTRSPF
jgi:hypothetical protein